MIPVGSVLSYQCIFIPADFNIYSNHPAVSECDFNYLQFPDFPFSNTKNKILSYTDKIKDASKMSIINKLKLNNDEVSTRNQAIDPEWCKQRKNRFAASLCNGLGSNAPKTSKGFKTITRNIIHGNEKQKCSKVTQFKLSKHYESYTTLMGHETVVEPCYLFTNSQKGYFGSNTRW